MSQFYDVDETHISFTTLNPTHVIPVKVGQLRQLFLREFALDTKLPKSIPENLPWVWIWHRAMIGA